MPASIAQPKGSTSPRLRHPQPPSPSIFGAQGDVLSLPASWAGPTVARTAPWSPSSRSLGVCSVLEGRKIPPRRLSRALRGERRHHGRPPCTGPRPPRFPTPAQGLCQCNSLSRMQGAGCVPGRSRRPPHLTGGEGCRPGRPPSPWAPPAPGRRGGRTGAAHPAGICARRGKPAAGQAARKAARAQRPACRRRGPGPRAARWAPYRTGGPQHHLQLPPVELHAAEEAVQEPEQSPVAQPAGKQANEQPQGGHGCPQTRPRLPKALPRPPFPASVSPSRQQRGLHETARLKMSLLSSRKANKQLYHQLS